MAGREALYLLQRAGCQRLGLITSDARTASLLERERVFVEAAKAASLPVTVTRAGPTSYQSGTEAARRLFGRSQSPDGVFCVTDLLALGFMDAARLEFGITIPDQLCVVGFDDIEEAGWDSYRLTTFAQPLDSLADEVIELLLHPEKAVSTRRVVEPIPVWRGSVRPAAR
jgi:DNA-binding LacI/PurR family transcriptional regulator